jgi:UDP-N-acetylglucosamine--N-acetylmuramyl-(pentapeptide) pyrophosphoryl-undecaprenol N-acetylglucosamine transferase
MRILLAGGGTAGHIEPALNLADEMCRRNERTQVLALGTARGLEVSLVPARGYELALISAVPMPRRLNLDLVKLPKRLRHAIAETRKVITDHNIDVVVGFGGYVSIPAYFAARNQVPFVVHEANARAGIANRVGARFASAVAECFPGSLPHAVVTGNPLRQSIAQLNRQTLRDRARAHFGIASDKQVVLVFGGSLGAQNLNHVVGELVSNAVLGDTVILHSYGHKNEAPALASKHYVPVPYIEHMDLAYAAADFVICRSGAMTVAELTAVGLPACYVPLAHGNGEQALNAQPVVTAGGGMVVADADFSSSFVRETLVPLLASPQRLTTMSDNARSLGKPDAAERLADLVESVAGGTR